MRTDSLALVLSLALSLPGCSVLTDPSSIEGNPLVDAQMPVGEGDAGKDPMDGGKDPMDGGHDAATDAHVTDVPDGGHDAGEHNPGGDGDGDGDGDAGHDAGPPLPRITVVDLYDINTLDRPLPGDMSSVVIGPDGNPIIFYHGHGEEDDDLGVYRCADPACKQRLSVRSAERPGNGGSYIRAIVDHNGIPVLAYNQATWHEAKFRRCNEGSCDGDKGWFLQSDYSLDNENVGSWSAIAIQQNGAPVISYYDPLYHSLRAALCLHPDCCGNSEKILCKDSPAPPTMIVVAGDTSPDAGTSDAVGAYSSVAVGGDGFPVFSYYNESDSSLELAHCRDAACASIERHRVDGALDDVGQFTSTVIMTDRRPLIFYFDLTHGDLKAAACHDAACTSAQITVIDGQGSAVVGRYASAVMGPMGYATVSYYDETNGTLKLARCQNEACTSSTTRVVDGGESARVGEWTSLALREGMPVISYRDVTHKTLKLATCTREDCEP